MKKTEREEFDNSKPAYESDDIKYAFEYNGLSGHLPNIKYILAEVCGENDGCDWHWILEMKDKTYRYASGGCDYTGWDCQSSAYISEPVSTLRKVLNLAPEIDSYKRNIRTTLNKQLKGELPKGIYEETTT